MFARLRAVWTTYRTRKLLWLLAGLYGLMNVGSWMAPPRRFPVLHAVFDTRWQPRREFRGLTEFANWDATDDELRELRGLSLDGGYPDHDNRWTPEVIEKLGRCTGLRELHLLNVELTPAVGAALGQLQSLQHLQLSLTGSPVPSMAYLPPLASLTRFQVPVVPQFELGLLAQHPRLRLVELRDHRPLPPVPGSLNPEQEQAAWQRPSTLHEARQIEQIVIQPQSEAGRLLAESGRYDERPAEAYFQTAPVTSELCAELARLPNLRLVEVRSAAGRWPPELTDDAGVRAALAGRTPAVRLNPTSVDLSGPGWLLGGQAAVLWLLLLGLQLSAQFSSGYSRVLPGYARPHLCGALGLLGLHVGLQTLITMRNYDARLLPALATACVLPGLCAVLSGAAIRHLRRLNLVGLVPLWLVIGGMFGARLFNAALIGAYLQGEYPVVALGLLAGGLTAIVWGGRSWERLARELAELGIRTGVGWQQFLQQIQMLNLRDREATPGRRLRFNPWDRIDVYLQRLVSAADRTTRGWRLDRWRCGEPQPRKLGMVLAALLLPTFLSVTALGTYRVLVRQPVELREIVAYAVLGGPFMAPFCMWLQVSGLLGRRPLLGQELLRPMTRREVCDLIVWSVWYDLWPALLIALGYALLSPLVLAWTPPEWLVGSEPALAAYGVLCAALVFVVWLGAVYVQTIERAWLRTCTLIAVFFLLTALLQFGVMAALFGWASARSGQLFLAAAIICSLLAMVLWRVSRRRLPQVEWGRWS